MTIYEVLTTQTTLIKGETVRHEWNNVKHECSLCKPPGRLAVAPPRHGWHEETPLFGAKADAQ